METKEENEENNISLMDHFFHIKDKFLAYDLNLSEKVKRDNEINFDFKEIIQIYKVSMVYIGWLCLCDKIKFGKVSKDTVEKYLILPYEILQVWRTHILSTSNYIKFCHIVTNGKQDMIPFKPPKIIWRNTNYDLLKKNFFDNFKVLSAFDSNEISQFEILFKFEVNYLKNCFCFNLDKESPAFIKIQQDIKSILKNINPELENLQLIVKNVEEKIFTLLEILENDSLSISENIDKTDNLKNSEFYSDLKKFEDFLFPENFLIYFALDHLLSLKEVKAYFKEYLKFMLLISQIEQPICPSEQVDQVWHYHLTFVEEYSQFSLKFFHFKVLSHKPYESHEDTENLKEIYSKTLDLLEKQSGFLENKIWPTSDTRFKQKYTWYDLEYL
jgi:hypothetical protein